jgi:exonuclease VII large subunit
MTPDTPTAPANSQKGSSDQEKQKATQTQELHRLIEMLRAQLEQAKLQILGMDQRLSERQEKLDQVVAKADKEGKRFDAALSQQQQHLNSSR